MIDYKLSREQREYAWGIVNIHCLANRGNESDGNKEHQFTGVLGEIVFCDFNHIERPLYNTGFDNGIDLQLEGVNIDIKTMGRNYDFKEGWVNNLMASQVEGDDYNNDIYLFANINKKKKSIQYIGWIAKNAVLKKFSGIKKYLKGEQRKRDDGTMLDIRADLYEIPFTALKTFDSMVDLKMQLQSYKLFYKDKQI